jgi:hypothetical protein
MQHTTPTIILPTKNHMSTTVLLDKAHEDEYGFSRPSDTILRLLITRDSSAVQRLRTGCAILDDATMLLEVGHINCTVV